MGPKSAREDERDAADKFEDSKGGPHVPWERAEGWDISTDFIEEKNFHDTRGCVEKRGHDLENPQYDIHSEERLSGSVMG